MTATKPTDCQRVLELLREHRGQWVARPYRQLGVMWHSRVADLRKKGHVIEMRVVIVPGDKRDWQYRIVEQDA